MYGREHKTRFLGAILVLCATSFGALAETVMIEGAGQSKGQGWLFGSPDDANCWIATPAHVVKAGKTGDATDFVWRDVEGGQGSGVATFIPKVGTDLAFAKVIGRSKGYCLSRLGADSITASVRRQPDVEAIIMQRTHTDPQAMKVRSFNGDFLTFAPANNTVKSYMKPGISGAPLILRRSDGLDVPLGLITTVERDQSAGYALRFDTIKALFLSGYQGASVSAVPAQKKSFDIISVTGLSSDSQNAVDAILTQDRCWIGRPSKDKRSFNLVVKPISNQGIAQAILEFDEACGPPPKTIITEYRNGTKWRTFGQCRLSETQAHCNFPKPVADDIRFTFIARDGLDRAVKSLSLN